MWSATGLRVTVGADVHARRAGRCARALSASRARQLALPQPRRRPLRGQDARGARRDGPLGVVVRRARLRQRRLGGPLHRQRHADARDATAPASDLEGFFWRQVVARSPLTRVKGTPYDDAWRAINQLLIHGSIASHQRNVFLRNDGQGGFDEVSGAVGLDLDQDGRSFAVLDLDRDGDPDLVVMAARQAPQLRVFRNDFAARGAALAIRLVGHGEQPRRDRRARDASRPIGCAGPGSCRPAPGFSRSTRRSCCSAWARASASVKLTVEWPSGAAQVFTDVPLNEPPAARRRRRRSRAEPFARGARASKPPAQPRSPTVAPRHRTTTWLYEPFPAPDFSLQDLTGRDALARGAARAAGGPAVLVDRTSAASRAALDALARGSAGAGAGRRRRARHRARCARGAGTRPRGVSGVGARGPCESRSWA